MSSVRRLHAAGLALGALLLACLPPALAGYSAAPTNRTSVPPSNTTRSFNTSIDCNQPTAPSSMALESSAKAKAVPTVAAETVSAEHRARWVWVRRSSAAKRGKNSRRRAVLTRDLYVAGHSLSHPELCPELGARLKVAILITSAPSHRRERDAIRMTWGHFAMRSDIALAFVLGAHPDSMHAAIRAEDALYGDIIIGRSLDSYSNLTLKTLSMLEWMESYCPYAPRLLKTDDDVFINVPKLLEFAAAPGRANATFTIWGKVRRKDLPDRNMKSKYYVQPIEFPGLEYPTFTTGPAYLMTADVIRPLLEAAPAQPFLRLEDVFFTGVLSQRLGIRRRLAPEFHNEKVKPHLCAVHNRVSIHMVQYHEQFDLWRKLMDGKTMCINLS